MGPNSNMAVQYRTMTDSGAILQWTTELRLTVAPSNSEASKYDWQWRHLTVSHGTMTDSWVVLDTFESFFGSFEYLWAEFALFQINPTQPLVVVVVTGGKQSQLLVLTLAGARTEVYVILHSSLPCCCLAGSMNCNLSHKCTTVAATTQHILSLIRTQKCQTIVKTTTQP